MTTFDWQPVLDWYERIQDATADQKTALLKQLHDESEQVYQAVRHMLAADANTGFMQQPPLTQISADQHSPALIGRYEILETVAVGGMGQVFKAIKTDADVTIEVAVKVIRNDLLSEAMLARFTQEKNILSRLKHPNIARLMDSGVAGGEPYLVTEWVDGEKLSTHLNKQQPKLTERLSLFTQIASAVSHAHQQLILHRDLKPDNIMIDRHGQVKLLDFGIARMLDPQLTEVGNTQIFTPEYAAPEQVTGQSVSIQTDVYALGLLLYYLVTGKPRFEFNDLSWQARLSAITNPPGTSLEELKAAQPDPLIKHDLALIINQACHVDPARRYETVSALADDLRRYSQHRPVRAAGDDWWYRWRLFFKRHTLASILVSFSLISLLMGLGFSQQARLEARESENQAIREAEKNRQIRLFYDALLQQASPVHGGSTEISFRDMLVQSDPDYDINDIDDVDLKAEIAAQISSLYEQYGESERRMHYGTLARDLFRQRLPGRASSFVNISNNLALSHIKNGDTGAASQLLNNTLSTINGVPVDPAELAETHINLGQAMAQSGQYEQARDHYNQARQLALPIDYREGLGKIVYYQTFIPGLADEDKLRALQTAQSHFSAALPEDHPNLLSIRNSLAILYKDRGDYKAAEQTLSDLRQLEQKQQGQASINTLINHADSLFYLGRTEAASEAIHDALSQLDQQNIEQGISRLSATIIAGRIHGDLEDHQAARDYLAQAQVQINDQWPQVPVFQLIMDSYLLELHNKTGQGVPDQAWITGLEERTGQLDTSGSRNRRIALNAYLSLTLWLHQQNSPRTAALITRTQALLNQQPARQGWPVHLLNAMQSDLDPDLAHASVRWLQSHYPINHLFRQLNPEHHE